MRPLPYEPDEDAAQKGEDVGLQEADEYLEEAYGHSHCHGRSGHRIALEGEDQTDQREQNHVTRGHVREETYREREGLGELSDHLDHRHDHEHERLEEKRHVLRRDVEDGPEVAPTLRADPGDLDHHERDHREHGGHGDVARSGGTVRNETEQIGEQDEEEQRQPEWNEGVAVRPHVGKHDLVAEVEHHRFHPGREALRCTRLVRVTIVRDRRWDQYEHAEDRRDAEHDHVLRGRQVDRESADVHRLPARQLDLAHEGELEMVRVGDVRRDNVDRLGLRALEMFSRGTDLDLRLVHDRRSSGHGMRAFTLSRDCGR